jgi:hypothetical protein
MNGACDLAWGCKVYRFKEVLGILDGIKGLE